jgi:hypothetical protein
MHYNGSAWTVLPSPSPGTVENYLSDVASLGPGNVWATGWWYDSGGDYHALVIHWDGTAWTPVATPSPAGAFLTGITALGPADIWAVGSYYAATALSLVLHWDGTAWTQVPIASPFKDLNTLWGVSGTGSTDVWTVGGDYDWVDYATGTLIQHWDGHGWTVVPGPKPPGATAAVLGIVTARTPTDAWATGWWLDADRRYHALVTHWDGTAWRLVTLPDLGTDSSYVDGVVAFSHNDVWVLGTTGFTVTNPADPYDPGTGTPLALHWNGTGWTAMSTAVSGGKFFDAVRVGADELWGIGAVSHPGGRWNDNLTTLTQRLQLC